MSRTYVAYRIAHTAYYASYLLLQLFVCLFVCLFWVFARVFLHAAVGVLNVVESDRENKGVKAVARVVVVGHVPLCPSCAVVSAATVLGQRA